jgi:cellulose synthase/poly-beta-1,6-N-acetylglucosamine synthase-like glycosyltransferase
MNVLTGALLLLGVVLLLPCTVLLVQVLAALLARKHDVTDSPEPGLPISPPPEVRLLMPAHNEADCIAEILRALLPQLDFHKRLVLVADNCTDATADIARRVAGNSDFVEVIERHNPDLRGKGYALDHGVRHLGANPPDVILVVDADCHLKPGSIETLAMLCLTTGRPVQALDLMQAPAGGSIKTRLAEFAWLVKNQVRALGYLQLGLPCQLMGTGMAFTWSQVSQAKLATGQLVEDMQLGIDLARSGMPPLFCPQALVTSVFPSAAEGLQTQRTRWEHGHLGVILTQVPRLLWQALTTGNGALLAMALDLCVPPLALLTLLTVGTLTASCATAIFGGGALPVLLAAMAITMLGLAVMLAWWNFGRGVISLKQLCHVPLYVLAKLPLYFYFLVKRQSVWVRSKRDGEL